MTDATQADLFVSARTARDDAISTVLGHEPNEWKRKAYGIILAATGEFTGEDLRFLVRDAIGNPHHPNVWGGLIHHAVKRGYIREIGMGQMKDKRSHARRTPVYAPSNRWLNP